MPTITSRIPRQIFDQAPVPMAPCIWCGEPTIVRAETPFRPDLGTVPLMLTCGAEIILLYNDYQAGVTPTHEQALQLTRLLQLPAGGAS